MGRDPAVLLIKMQDDLEVYVRNCFCGNEMTLLECSWAASAEYAAAQVKKRKIPAYADGTVVRRPKGTCRNRRKGAFAAAEAGV